MNVLDLAQQKVTLKKVSNTAGGEWQGPCPGCGGDDRFHVWPDQYDGRGAYWCRGCGKWGDNIQFLRDFEGLSFSRAVEQLGLDVSKHYSHLTQPAPRREKPEFVPTTSTSPAGLWKEKAEKLTAWAAANLQGNAEMIAWLSSRGISAATAARYRLGWNPGEEGKDFYRSRKGWGLPDLLREDGKPKALWIPRGLTIPCVVGGHVVRVRIRRPEGEPRYYVLPGSSMATMVLEPSRRAFVVVESELDALAVAAGNDLAGAVGLGSASVKPDAAAFAILQGSLQILNALDYDQAGAKAIAWWAEQFRQNIRWPVPRGKDPGEAVALGIDLNRWIIAGLPPMLTLGVGDGGSQRPKTKEGSKESEKAGIHPASATVISQTASEAQIEQIPAWLASDVAELLQLLRKNPTVKIINMPKRYTVLRDGKYVGGRINELVFRSPAVLDYIADHPAQEITWRNLISPAGPENKRKDFIEEV